MGTRNLTIVRSKKKDKVIQYGQWDGYPEGQGRAISEFLRVADLNQFKKQVDSLKTYSKRAIKQAYKDAGHTGEDWVLMDIAKKVYAAHPALCRDHGAGILEFIYNGDVKKVALAPEWNGKTVDEGSWVEYYYLIDLDNETIQMNGGRKYSFKQWSKKDFIDKLVKKEEK